MIKKTLRNAAVGTLAAGALILPATATIAPQMQLMACQYPDSQATNTEQTLSRYAVRKGEVISTVTVDNLDGKSTPNGEVTVSVYRPNGDLLISKTKTLSGNDDTVSFTFGGWGERKNGTYRFVAVFEGKCKYSDSRDRDFLVVR